MFISSCTSRRVKEVREVSSALIEIKQGATKISQTSQHLTNKACSAIAIGLKTIPNRVDTLDLFDNDIGPSGVTRLAQALESDTCQLKNLKLAYNAIGDAGAIRLAGALKHPYCKLEKLDLSGCSIEQAGAQAIVDAIKYNTKLKTVYLFGNEHDLEDALNKALAGQRRAASHRVSRIFAL